MDLSKNKRFSSHLLKKRRSIDPLKVENPYKNKDCGNSDSMLKIFMKKRK